MSINPNRNFQRVYHHWSVNSVKCPSVFSENLIQAMTSWCLNIWISKTNLLNLLLYAWSCLTSVLIHKFCDLICMVHSFRFSFLLLSFGLSCDDASFPLSLGSWDAVAGWRGRVDSAVLSSILQRNEHGLLSPPPRRRGDAVTQQVWSPSPETTGPLGRSGRGRPVLSQPLHAPTLRGRICLLCSRAGDLSVTARTDSETMCMWISRAETYSISHNVRPRSASQGSRASRAKYNHAQHVNLLAEFTMCIFWATPGWTTL